MEIKIKKLKKQTKGITLVSLVVTIIVLLILAGVTLNFTLGEDGIFKKAGDAVDKYKEAQEKEKNMLMDLESSMDNITGEPIPIKTEEQLLKIGTGEKVEVDGVEYSFNTGRKYILQNDIETSKEYEKIAEKVKNREILLVGNGNKIVETREDGTKAYYTEDSNFYIAVNKYGYVLEGLELYYDGIDNAGEGSHDNKSSIWKDLSGNNRNGILENMDNSWNDYGLYFDGIDDYVPIAEMNYDNVTLESVISRPENAKVGGHIISNIEAGGYMLYIDGNTGKIGFGVYINEKQAYEFSVGAQGVIQPNKRYSISASYDGKKMVGIASGNSIYNQKNLIGTIGKTQNNTMIMLGVNPSGNLPIASYYNGTIYSTRIYSKALSDEERAVNYANDKERYLL